MENTPRKRIYEDVLKEHLADNRQMAFLTGPRQCGKTTLAKALSNHYFTWDDLATRRLVAGEAAGLATAAGLNVATESRPIITLDEIHKFVRWKNFIKGFFDIYEERMRLIVTGSARLDIYKRGGDSLMGRYFLYHMHPLGVAELVRPELEVQETHAPSPTPTGTPCGSTAAFPNHSSGATAGSPSAGASFAANSFSGRIFAILQRLPTLPVSAFFRNFFSHVPGTWSRRLRLPVK